MGFKEDVDRMTELIISCWDCNNEDDGLTFDERLEKKVKELKGQDKVLMNMIIEGV